MPTTLSNVIILGCDYSGKTTLSTLLQENQAPHSLGNQFFTIKTTHNEVISCWDTKNITQPSAAFANIVNKKSLFIICIDLTKDEKDICEEIDKHIQNIQRHVKDNPHLFLVGTKTDRENHSKFFLDHFQNDHRFQGCFIVSNNKNTLAPLRKAILETYANNKEQQSTHKMINELKSNHTLENNAITFEKRHKKALNNGQLGNIVKGYLKVTGDKSTVSEYIDNPYKNSL